MNIWIPVFDEETKLKKQRHKRHRKEKHFVSLRRYEASRFFTEEYYKYLKRRSKNEKDTNII